MFVFVVGCFCVSELGFMMFIILKCPKEEKKKKEKRVKTEGRGHLRLVGFVS